jgi:superoxide reductase
MPRLFTYNNFATGSDKVRLYADKHSPVIICESETVAVKNKPFKVRVKIGKTIKHPNTPEHHFEYVQLWNLETLVGEVRLQRASYGDQPIQIETDFTFIPKISLRLTAVAYCNKHGLWQSEEVFIPIKYE